MNWADKHSPPASAETGGGGEPPEDDRPVAFARFKGNDYWPGITFNRETGDAFGWPYTHLVHWKFEAGGRIILKFIDDRVSEVHISGRNLRKGFDMIRQRQCGDVYERHVGDFDEAALDPAAAYIENVIVYVEGEKA